MKHIVATLHRLANGFGISDVAVDQLNREPGHRGSQVVAIPTNKVIEDADVSRACIDQLIDDMRTHESRAAGHQHARTCQREGHEIHHSDLS